MGQLIVKSILIVALTVFSAPMGYAQSLDKRVQDRSVLTYAVSKLQNTEDANQLVDLAFSLIEKNHREYFRANLNRGTELPNYQLINGKMVITVETFKVKIEVVNALIGHYKINGQDFHLDPFKPAAMLLNEIKSHLKSTNRYSEFSLFPKAHAFVISFGALIIAGVATLAGLTYLTMVSSKTGECFKVAEKNLFKVMRGEMKAKKTTGCKPTSYPDFEDMGSFRRTYDSNRAFFSMRERRLFNDSDTEE